MRVLMTLAAAGALTAGVAGCSTGTLDTRRDVTQAALAQYPGNARPSQTLRLAAVDNPGDRSVEIVNLSDTGVPGGKVWVNGRFVSQVPAIPARSTAKVSYSDLLEAGPGVMDLRRANAEVSKVEFQTEEGLVTVQGPSRR